MEASSTTVLCSYAFPQKEQSTFCAGSAEKSTGVTVTSLLAQNVYQISGMVVPRKYRLLQIGELTACVLHA